MTTRLLLTEFRKNTFFQFNVVLKFVLGILLLQLFFICFEIPVYVDLFVGPLLYLYISKTDDFKKSSFRVSFAHILFACFLFWLTIWNTSEFVLFLDALSLLIYSFLIRLRLKKSYVAKQRFHSYNIFVSFCTFYLGVVSLVLFIQFLENNFFKIFSFSKRFLIVGILSTVICFLMYLLFNARNSIAVLEEDGGEDADEKAPLETEKFESVVVTESFRTEEVKKINLFFEKSDLYLQANFTLEDMSIEVDIPRSVLTDVMNKEMQTGFYAILGEHRIHHAKKMLLDKENFTIEALVFQCGFHSKSTFNKYFKQFVGQTPSSFRVENMHNIRPF